MLPETIDRNERYRIVCDERRGFHVLLVTTDMLGRERPFVHEAARGESNACERWRTEGLLSVTAPRKRIFVQPSRAGAALSPVSLGRNPEWPRRLRDGGNAHAARRLSRRLDLDDTDEDGPIRESHPLDGELVRFILDSAADFAIVTQDPAGSSRAGAGVPSGC